MRQLKITKSITNRESASLDKYLQEIGREGLITVEEEVELAQRIRKGDRLALEKLTKANLRFVVSVAKQYQNEGLTLREIGEFYYKLCDIQANITKNNFVKIGIDPAQSQFESAYVENIKKRCEKLKLRNYPDDWIMDYAKRNTIYFMKLEGFDSAYEIWASNEELGDIFKDEPFFKKRMNFIQTLSKKYGKPE